MARAIVLAFLCGIVLTVARVPHQTLAQTTQPPQLVTQLQLPGSNLTKLPDVAAGNNIVHVSGNINRNDAVYWTKADSATSFPDPQKVGEAPGFQDYSTASVAVASDGTVGYAWINQDDRAIYYRQKAPGQDWGPQRTVIRGGGDFRVELDVGISTSKTIFVVWRVPDRPVQFRTSSDGGAGWSGSGDISQDVGFGISTVATGPNNQVIVGYNQGENDKLQIYVGTWNGSGWDRVRLSSSGRDFAGPSATISGTGVAYVSWRGVEGGVFFAERKSDGSWPVSRLVDDTRVDRRTAISADAQNNLHIFWESSAAGSADVYYAFRPANGDFSPSPLRVTVDGASLFNTNLTSSLAGTLSYGHGVSEAFVGDNQLVARYFLFSGTGAGSIGAQPQIENNAATVGNKPTLSVNFINVSGSPNQVRWRWGAAPTDAANDSSGWQTFANPLPVPVASGVNVTDCVPDVLYTQVRNTQTNTTESPAKQDQIVIDNSISNAVRAFNPYSIGRIGVFTPVAGALIADLPSDGGASDGHPDYTRAPVFYLEVGGATDCSGLQDFRIGASSATFGAPYGIPNNYFANTVPFPNPANVAQGPVSLVVRVADKVGNAANFARTLNYDSVKPTLGSGGAVAITTPDATATLLATLTFSGINVTDPAPGYPGGYWGVWVANSRTPVADPLNSPLLIWTPRALPSGGASPVLSKWPLSTGIAADQVVPGTYYVYVRFLDGAGNPTDGFLQAQINLTSVTGPSSRMPMLFGPRR